MNLNSLLLTVQADTEDIDLWFLENSAKFLPEGRPADNSAFPMKKSKRMKVINILILWSYEVIM